MPFEREQRQISKLNVLLFRIFLDFLLLKGTMYTRFSQVFNKTVDIEIFFHMYSNQGILHELSNTFKVSIS